MKLTALFVISVVLTLLGMSVATAADEPVVLHVSPEGRDDWTGRLPKPAADGSDGPLATISAAQQAARQQRKTTGGSRAIDVQIAPGTYRLIEPLVFEPADSGTATAPVTYRGVGNGRVVISGGQPIRGWEQEPNGRWSVTLPEVRDGQWYFRQLFVNDRRATLARHPNEGTLRTAGPLKPLANREQARGDREAKIGFRVGANDLPPDADDADAIWVAFHAWTASLHHVESLDRKAGTVRFTAPSQWPMSWWEQRERYYLQNIESALDAPGEWYLNRKSGKLTYLPREGETLDTVEVIAPRLTEVLIIAGNPANAQAVEHVNFDNLTFAHADWTLSRNEPADGQAAAFLPTALVHARGTRHVKFTTCEIAHSGTYGLWLDEGCQETKVQDCHIHDLGAGGVRLGQTSLPGDPTRRSERNTVTECLIHDGGHVFPAGVGVWIGRSSHNQVTNCEIADFYYTGVSVGWSWGYAESTANHNNIEFNHIHHIGQGLLSDMGGIYTLGVSPGTTLRHNHIHDVLSYSYGGWGLYPDEGSTELLIENNVVYRTKTGGFHQHYGRDNLVRNNILAFNALAQIRRTRNEPHQSFRFERNIVYYDQGTLFDGNWGDGNFTLDHNIYWRADGLAPVFPGDRTFAQWQEAGHDQHSLVTDPLFVNPQKFDFTLRDGSPATKVGFEPIDLSQIGLQSDRLKAIAAEIEWPTTEMPPPPEREKVSANFEDLPVGQVPREVLLSGTAIDGKQLVRVTDKAAAEGKQSLLIRDAEGLQHAWQPHLYWKLPYRRGTGHSRFAVKVEPGANLELQWRSGGSDYLVGPSVRLSPEGKLIAGGESLLDVPEGWLRCEIRCPLGDAATGKFSLTVTLPDGTTRLFKALRCANTNFRSWEWFGVMSLGTTPAKSYLDAVELFSELPK